MHKPDSLYEDDFMRYLLSILGDVLLVKLRVFSICIHESMSIGIDSGCYYV